MSNEYPSIIPSFGLHLWYVAERSPNWFDTLRISLSTHLVLLLVRLVLIRVHMGRPLISLSRLMFFSNNSSLLRRYRDLFLSIVFGDLLENLKQIRPFPAGLILHSYMGSAEMVPELSNLGSYSSFSGHNTYMNEQTAKKMLKSVPKDRILIETDAPDGLPNFNKESLIPVPRRC